jgi:hypothetical protein
MFHIEIHWGWNMLPLEGIVVDEKLRGNVERKCILRAKRLRSLQL